ncbi:hypothetical protein [Virgisporangium aliadipatigenens]|nr:hypothetical protein [Virgisporangium aliadipatigenens]
MGELASYRCRAPRPVPLHHLVAVARRRWSIKESFQVNQSGLGPGQHQCAAGRHRTAGHLRVRRARVPQCAATLSTSNTAGVPDGLTAITGHELRRLFPALIIELTRRHTDAITWSIYRRRRQALTKP